MKTDVDKIKMDVGSNAGIVWRALSEDRAGMDLDTLILKVGLSLFEVAAAIGWLARENKIGMMTSEDGKLRLSVYQEYYY